MANAETAGIPRALVYVGIASMLLVGGVVLAKGGLWTAGKVKETRRVVAEQDALVVKTMNAKAEKLFYAVGRVLDDHALEHGFIFPSRPQAQALVAKSAEIASIKGSGNQVLLVDAASLGLETDPSNLSELGKGIGKKIPIETLAYTPYIVDGKAKGYVLYALGREKNTPNSVVVASYGEGGK